MITREAPRRGAFVGRQRELSVIAACADAAAAGATQLVWIVGVGGAGKSSLVRRAMADLAGRFLPVQALADELSGDVSYATVAQLGVEPGPNPFAAGLAVVDRLAALQESLPVLVVVEDMHWADTASRAALLVAARRLQHDNVLLVMTSRPVVADDEWGRLVSDPDRCTRLELSGLTGPEIEQMADQAGIELSADQAARLQRHTLGHPLHARTLLIELTPEQLRSPGDHLPAPRSLAAATAAALAALPLPSQEFAAALAVLGRPTPLGVVADVAGLDDASSALEPLLHAGLVTWSPTVDRTPVEFVHPLYRQAVYDDVAPERRRHLHLAGAHVTTWGVSWAHRLAAADGPDGELADELLAGADFEVARHDLALAATYTAWAATVAPDEDRRRTLRLESTRLLIYDGQTARAAAQLAEVEPRPNALDHLVRGMLAFAQADSQRAERHLRGVETVEPPTEANRMIRAEAHSELSLLATLQGRADLQVLHARASLELVGSAVGHIERDAWWGLAIGEGTRHGPARGARMIETRLPQPAAEVPGDDAELLVARGTLRATAGEVRAAADDLRTAIELARAGFGFGQLPRAHLMLSRCLYWHGDWDEALLQARGALTFMDERPWMVLQAESAITLVAAARGDWADAERVVAAALEQAARLRTIESVTAASSAAVALAHARGDHRAVVDVVDPVASGTATIGDASALTILTWMPTYAASLVEIGELGRAAAEIERLDAAGDDFGLPVDVYVSGLRGRLAAARGELDVAAEHFDAALGAIGPDHQALEVALLHHAAGRLGRARGDRRRGEDLLRTAHAQFDRLGAVPYRERVADDLRAGGSAARPRRVRQPFELTPREADVAALVKKGMTNREVGAELYISAKSVEFHLRNVFGKLMISSRRELRDIEL